MRRYSIIFLWALLSVTPCFVAADESDLTGFKVSLAAQTLRTHSHLADARKLEALRPNLVGYALVYVFVTDRDLFPGKHPLPQEHVTYQMYGLAISDKESELRHEALVWAQVLDPEGAINVLRDYAPLLLQGTKDVEILSSSALQRLTRLLLLNKRRAPGDQVHPGPLDSIRDGLIKTTDLLPFGSRPTNIILTGFTGPQVHAFAVLVANDRWQPALLHLWAEERELALELLRLIEGPLFPYRISLRPVILPTPPDEEHARLLEALSKDLSIRLEVGAGWQTLVPSHRQVIGESVVVSGLLDEPALKAQAATLNLGQSELLAVDSLSVVDSLDLLLNDEELVRTFLKLGPSPPRPKNLLHGFVDFGDLGPRELAEFVQLAAARERPNDNKSLKPGAGIRNPDGIARYRVLAQQVSEIDIQIRQLIDIIGYLQHDGREVERVYVLYPSFRIGALKGFFDRARTQQEYVLQYLKSVGAPLVTGEFGTSSPADVNTIRVFINLK